jgi:hypothetical protein
VAEAARESEDLAAGCRSVTSSCVRLISRRHRIRRVAASTVITAHVLLKARKHAQTCSHRLTIWKDLEARQVLNKRVMEGGTYRINVQQRATAGYAAGTSIRGGVEQPLKAI